MRENAMKKGLWIGVLILAIATAATLAYAGSALQLFTSGGVDYIKHVNFNAGSGAQTTLLIQKDRAPGNVQIKISARATDGTTLSQSRTIHLNSNETRSLVFTWNKPITDLNFIQLITNRNRDGNSGR